MRWAGLASRHGSHQTLQELLRGVEFQGAWRPHALHVAQVGDGEVEGERHGGWSCGCSGRGRGGPTLSQARDGYGGRAWGPSPIALDNSEPTQMADGLVAYFQSLVWTLDHHMQQVKEGTIWKLYSFEGDSVPSKLIMPFNSIANLFSSMYPPNQHVMAISLCAADNT